MIIDKFDFKIARFNSWDELIPAEVKQADLVQIVGHVPGGIYHADQMLWYGNLSGFDSPESFFRSKRERKSTLKNREFFETQGYRFEVVPLTTALFREFSKLYNDTTMVRERPLRFDLETSLLGRVKVKKPIFLVGMFKGKKLISGLTFSVSNGKAMVAFGAKKKFKLRGGVGGVLELILLEYCFAEGYTEVSHGSSTNPAGLYSSAGVFEFKARAGYSAFPSGRWRTTFIRNPKVRISDLVFVGMVDGILGYTVVSDDPPDEVLKKYKTREVKNLQIISVTDSVKMAESVFVDVV